MWSRRTRSRRTRSRRTGRHGGARAGARGPGDRAGARDCRASSAPTVSRLRWSPGHRRDHRRRGARQLRRRPDGGPQPCRDLHGAGRDRRLGLLFDIGLPALPAVRRGPPRRRPQAANRRVLGPTAPPHRSRLLAGPLRGHVHTPCRSGYRSRRLEGVRLPLSLSSDLLALPDTERHLRCVVTLRRDDLLPVHPVVCRTDRLAPLVADGGATGTHRADRPGDHDPDQCHVALHRVAVPARPLVLLASGDHLASGLLGSLRSRHGSGGRQCLDAPRGAGLPLDVLPPLPLALVGLRRRLLLGGGPYRDTGRPHLHGVDPRHGSTDPLRGVRLLPAPPRGLRPTGKGADPPVPAMLADRLPRRHLLRDLSVARDLDLPDPQRRPLSAFHAGVLGVLLERLGPDDHVGQPELLRAGEAVAALEEFDHLVEADP